LPHPDALTASLPRLLSTAYRTARTHPNTLAPRVLSPPPVTVDQAAPRPSHPRTIS